MEFANICGFSVRWLINAMVLAMSFAFLAIFAFQ